MPCKNSMRLGLGLGCNTLVVSGGRILGYGAGIIRFGAFGCVWGEACPQVSSYQKWASLLPFTYQVSHGRGIQATSFTPIWWF